MRKISVFLAASAALLVAACGHQPSASQQTAQAVEPSQQIQLAAANPAPPVQLAVATVEEDNRPFAPDEFGGVPEGTSIADLEAAQDAANAGRRPLPPGYVYDTESAERWAYDGQRCREMREGLRRQGIYSRDDVIREVEPFYRRYALLCYRDS